MGDEELRGRFAPKLSLKIAIIVCAGILVMGAAAYLWLNHSKGNVRSDATTSPSQTISGLVSIPVYYPQNLPPGYSYRDDAKAVKPTVLVYSVVGPHHQVFYLSQQPIPPNFDFTAFAKKFLNPTSFSSDAGTSEAGTLGAQLVSSIQTNKNTWIIINSPATNSLTEIETVARSLEPAK